MAFKKFEMILDLSDNRTEIVKHTETGLYLKVLPIVRHKERYPHDEIVFVAEIFGTGLNGRKLTDRTSEVHLQVMKLHHTQKNLWDAEMLMQAVRFYVLDELGERLREVYICAHGQRMPFDASQFAA